MDGFPPENKTEKIIYENKVVGRKLATFITI